jgi:SAM-dependent methyltransferase
VLEQRSKEQERLDRPDFDARQVEGTFRYLVPVNRWFGGIRPQIGFFERESRHWESGVVQRVLDVGCGAGDAAVALAKWGRRRGYCLEIEAIDSHPLVVEYARERCRPYPEITVLRRDVLLMPGAEHDYVHASQLLHHFADEELPNLLHQLLGICNRKLLVNDLLRSPLHYGAAWVLSLFTSSVFRHDARLSIRKGFRIDELRLLLSEHGFTNYRLESYFLYRFLLIMDREGD